MIDLGDFTRLGKLQRAKNFDLSVASAPQIAVRWYLRAKFHLESGRPERALADLREAVRLEPKRGLFLDALASLYALGPAHLRDREQAVTLARRAIECVPGQWDFVGTLGLALYRAGKYSEATLELEKSARGQGDSPRAPTLFGLALCYHRLGQTEKARAAYARAAAEKTPRDEADLIRETEVLQAEAKALLGK